MTPSLPKEIACAQSAARLRTKFVRRAVQILDCLSAALPLHRLVPIRDYLAWRWDWPLVRPPPECPGDWGAVAAAQP